ncbi:hypothetical protein EXE43_02185 [Halorubrum sp. SS5]|nr:hypothetical protein EXE43_02185 [Halorubrum sp. SS5]
MKDQFRSLFTRQREFESRTNTELPQVARERLISIIADLKRYREMAHDELLDEAGISRVYADLDDSWDYQDFMMEADTVLCLSFIEHTIEKMWAQVTKVGYRGSISKRDVYEKISKIEDVFVTEGVLWDIEANRNSKQIAFRQLESEAMEDIDEKMQALAAEDPWGSALEGYNAAFDRYLSGDYDDTLVKNLYNSIEEVLKIICVDLEGWTEDREMSHGKYLQLLGDNNFYQANGITAPELNQLIDSMEKLVSKTGADRKQEHAYHDREYATLLIHQTGAYIYFLISRYDEYTN